MIISYSSPIFDGTYFKVVATKSNGQVTMAKCLLCPQMKNPLCGKGSSNFIRHLKTKHPLQAVHYENAKQKIKSGALLWNEIQ